MQVLDWRRDYAEVCGGPAKMLQQDGRLFDLRGQPVGEPVIEKEDPAPNGGVIPGDDDLADMDGNALKALVEMYGGTWKGVPAAHRFLRAQRA
jgi:hypothetical protein